MPPPENMLLRHANADLQKSCLCHPFFVEHTVNAIEKNTKWPDTYIFYHRQVLSSTRPLGNGLASAGDPRDAKSVSHVDLAQLKLSLKQTNRSNRYSQGWTSDTFRCSTFVYYDIHICQGAWICLNSMFIRELGVLIVRYCEGCLCNVISSFESVIELVSGHFWMAWEQTYDFRGEG